MDQPVYLDYNASTPLLKEVADAMSDVMYNSFGNPSSTHAFGQEEKRRIESARSSVARLINAQAPSEVIFTGGGTESNNMAIKGVAFAMSKKTPQSKVHIITSTMEHPATVEVCKYLERRGLEVTWISPVPKTHEVDVEAIVSAVRPETALISVHHANSEIGTIQPIRSISDKAKAVNPDVLVHVDASQTVGKIPVDVAALGVDLLTIAGHKFYGPKGVGALWIRNEGIDSAPSGPGITLSKQTHGAGHERGRRPGTENAILIAGLGAAAAHALASLNDNMQHAADTRIQLENILCAAFDEDDAKSDTADPSYIINSNRGAADGRSLPNTLSISFRGLIASHIMERMSNDVACSAGSACHANSATLSSVLKAIGVPEVYGLGTLRLTTGKLVTSDDVQRAATAIISAVRALRSEASAK